MPGDKDIGYAVTVVLPESYFTAELYVPVPGNAKHPDAWARRMATRQLARLASTIPEARLQVTGVRRVT